MHTPIYEYIVVAPHLLCLDYYDAGQRSRSPRTEGWLPRIGYFASANEQRLVQSDESIFLANSFYWLVFLL